MIGNKPHIIPSFKLFTKPAKVTLDRFELVKVVSLKILLSLATLLSCSSKATKAVVSFTKKTEVNKPKKRSTKAR